ncbi:MAG: response regulator [Gemmataceae bacterium]
MSTILLLSTDLMDTSKVRGAAQAQGVTVRTARTADSLAKLASESAPSLVIVDLGNPDLNLGTLMDSLRALPQRPRIVAFGSHVDAAALNAARSAGCDEVLPRSAFFQNVESEIPNWVTPQT